MAITRRQFLKRTGLATAGGFFGPALSNPFLREALASTIGDRYLVVIFLDGGNDGLNTVTPIANGDNTGTYGFSANLRTAYTDVRTSIRLTDSNLLYVGDDPGTNTPIGLHPGLQGLHNLHTGGDIGVAVIQGCGYPNPSLSHPDSAKCFETGDPLGVGDGTGWIGRHLAANYMALELPAMAINRGGIAGEFKQATTGVLGISRLRSFTFPYHSGPNTPSSERTRRNAAFQDLCDAAMMSGQSSLEFTGQVGNLVFSATQTYPLLHNQYVSARPSFNQSYEAVPDPDTNNPNNQRSSMAGDLREVAKTIWGVEHGVVNSRFFELANGGYDTHSNQGGDTGDHYNLHNEVGTALEIFFADIADMGVADKVSVLIWSEFSRRVEQNDSGTDHGSQGPVFLIGGKVNGGVKGNHPDIGEHLATLQSGNTRYLQGPANNPFRTTDIRDVYGTILKHWLNVPSGTVSSIFPADAGDPNTRWTAPNFDLPLFLP